MLYSSDKEEHFEYCRECCFFSTCNEKEAEVLDIKEAE